MGHGGMTDPVPAAAAIQAKEDRDSINNGSVAVETKVGLGKGVHQPLRSASYPTTHRLRRPQRLPPSQILSRPMVFSPSSPVSKPPRSVFESIYAFAPNRDTLGGTAYFIVEKDSQGRAQNLLVDTPPWDETTRQFLAEQGGVRWLAITHRTALGKAAALQKHLGCEVVIQEQEAYLLPDTPKTTFHRSLSLTPHLEVLWTPGYSPGSACVYYGCYGGVLFSGRHLLPNRQGHPEPLRFSKTFHWPRHLCQVEALRTRFSPETLAHLCPAANTGFLRGQRTIDNAYAQLQALDLDALRAAPALL